jgi:hypothetical protein
LFSATIAVEGETLRVTALLTVRLAEAVLPVPPLVELTAPEVLVNVPPDVPVTFKEIAQLAPVASEPPLNETIVLPATAVAVPAQLFVNAGVGATAKPDGSASESAKPDSLTVFAAGFVMVKVKLVVPLSAMLGAPKASAIEGGAATAIVAEALPPVPPSVDATLPVVLIGAPAAVPVTFSENVHEVFAARLAPFRLIELVAWVALIVPPPQAPDRPFGVEMIRPAGRVSLKPTPVSPIVLPAGLAIVKLTVADPFSGMLAALRASLMVGGAATARLAEAAFPAPALDDATAVLVFVKLPALLPVTLTESVQWLPAATEAPLSDRLPLPATAVAVPPQLFVSPFGVEIASPAGSVSLNPTPVSDTVFAAGLVIVKASEVVPFTAILGAPNDSAMVGAADEPGVGLGLGVCSGVGVGPGPALPPPPHAVRLTARQPASIAAQKLPAMLRQPTTFIRLPKFPSPGSVSATIGTRLACCVTQQPNWKLTDAAPVFTPAMPGNGDVIRYFKSCPGLN